MFLGARLSRLPRLAMAGLILLGGCSVTTRSGQPLKGAHPAQAEPEAPFVHFPRQPSSERIPLVTGDGVWGSPTAPVTVVVFTDLECPFCARAELTLQALRNQYGAEKLRVVIKHALFHDHSELAARYAQAALLIGGPEAFYRFVALGFEYQRDLASEEVLGQLIERAGVDRTRASETARSQAVSEKLGADADLVQALNVTGTPTFYVNGARISGAQPPEVFSQLIDEELAAAERLLAEGVAPQMVYATRVGTNSALEAVQQAKELTERRRQEAEKEAENSTIWKVPVAGTPLRGPRDAPITIVEFSDYECPFCRRAELTIDKLFELYPGKLRLSRRETPLAFHKHALPAATLALEARARKGDAGYYQAASKLYQSGLEPAHLDDVAKELGLDVERTRRAIEKNAHAAVIERDQELAAELKATGTPHFFVNGWRISGAQSLEAFRTVIDAQLKVAEALVAKGTPRAKVYDELQKAAKEPVPERWELPPTPASAPSRGRPNAPVVIELFGDLECPFCARAATTLGELERSMPGQLRIVWRHLPLESIHSHARLAARAAIEARMQKGDAAFWEMVSFFYRDLEQPDAFSEARLRGYASALGLDAQRLLEASSDRRHDPVIDADLAVAQAAGMEAAPSLSIGGLRMVGAQSLPTFRYLVRQAQKKPAAK
jgi:protein-disulfide isomerase